MTELEKFNLEHSNSYIRDKFETLSNNPEIASKLQEIYNQAYDKLMKDIDEAIESSDLSQDDKDELIGWNIEFQEGYMTWPCTDNTEDFVSAYLSLNDASDTNDAILSKLLHALYSDSMLLKFDPSINRMPRFSELTTPMNLILVPDNRCKLLRMVNSGDFLHILTHQPRISTPIFKIWFNL